MPKIITIATTNPVAPRTMRPLLENLPIGGFVSETSAGLVSGTFVVSTAIESVSLEFIGVSPCLGMSWFSFHFNRNGWFCVRTLFMQQAEHCGNKDQRGHRGTEQASNHGAPERCILLASVAEAERHGYHADSHGQSSHQDWPKARESGLNGRLDRIAVG